MYKDLSTGVNLIYGPNGSGKSTTALVIQELLWPGDSGLKQPTVSGRFTIGNTTWSIQINAGHADIGSSEGTGTTPGLGPAEYRSRYMLALHELINEKNTNFAKIIAAESQGGYDLEAAGYSLGFNGNYRKDRKAVNRWNEARRRVKDAIAVQQKIYNENSHLPGLKTQHKKAKEAGKMLSVLEQALEMKNVELCCKKLRIQIDDFPRGIALLQGNEREKLNELSGKHRAAEEKLSKANAGLEETSRLLKELNLSEDQVQNNIISVIRELQADLLDVENNLDTLQRSLLSAEVKERETRNRIGDHISDAQLNELNTVEIEDLSSFSMESDRVQADEIVLEERKRTLSQPCHESVRNLRTDQIQEGISSVKQWLETPEPAEIEKIISTKLLIAASALIALLGLTLGIAYSPAWALLILPAAGFLFLGRNRAPAVKNDARDMYASNYCKTGLHQPDCWETETVLDLLRSLVNMADLRIREDSRIHGLNLLKEDEAALAIRKGSLQDRKTLLERNLGFSAAVDNRWLPLLVQNIMVWQESNSTLATTHAELNRLQKKQIELQRGINQSIRGYRCSEVESSGQAATLIDNLNLKFSNYGTATQNRHSAEKRILEARDDLSGISMEKLALFEKLGLDPSREGVIDNWLEKRPEYLALQTQLKAKEAVRDNWLQSGDNKLLDMDTFELEELIRNTEKESSRRDELLMEINRIKLREEEALSGHDLSNAMAVENAARVVLEDLREQHSFETAGDMLIEWVREVAVDKARPLVFKRACELVAEFTRGHLKLQIDDRANTPRFKASVDGRPSQPVDQLSIGERVQVLIAIRTAFLELNEPVRLPLLLDEALGTSDDLRAGLIIDAVIRIARSGRQVFYFTAQHDEIGKWLSKLESTGTEHRMFDLGKIRNMGAADSFPLRIPDPDQRLAAASPVQPHGMTRDEYGRALGVPGINPLDENLDRLHLWHLVSDSSLLYGLLKLNIEKWGQFKTLVKYGGRKLFTGSAIQFDAIYAAAAAVENGCKFWRAGRGLRVDRRVLMDSNCVSKVFIDRITNMAEGLGGNAEKIITGLRNKEIQRWPTSKTEELQDYFEEHGYTSTETVLSPEEIRVHVLAVLAEELNSNLIRPDHLDEIINSLPR
ncbi:MAG: hypothetical protein KAS73_07650 [Candidatus Sabulitectum sp.]|nr:hypothetical protein [Candidatus Sabulitectum sp.]